MSEEVAVADLLATWTFQRRADRVEVHRHRVEDGTFQLLVVENGRARTFAFTDFDRLVTFQSDMEAFLVRTGWFLAAFSPDRRTGRDRRNFPRDAPDRRRWWTDAPPPSK